MTSGRWVLLAYRLPRVPSTPRISLWRRLRRLGAGQVIDGLVALPADSRTREQFEWLADEVGEAGGEATVWLASPATAAQERGLVARMQAAVANEYREVSAAADEARQAEPRRRRRTLARLRRELQRIRRRDHFPPPERQFALEALAQLGESLEALRV